MVDTWLQYFHGEYNSDTSLLTGHIDATQQISEGLAKIVETTKSYDELKTELLKFIKERRDFKKDVDDKWNSNHPEQWGFPPWTP